jgi:C1A family cysteine protease
MRATTFTSPSDAPGDGAVTPARRRTVRFPIDRRRPDAGGSSEEDPMDVIELSDDRTERGMGWLPDRPDIRDYTRDNEEVSSLLVGTAVPRLDPEKVPATVDLRPWCSPIEDQGQLGSCTANAAAGVLEYYERRAFGKHLDASRLFIYKATRDMLGFTGDTGAYLRSTIGALAIFGAAPEKYWPYNISKFDVEPSAFCYAYAQSFQALRYYRLDPPPSTDKAKVLGQIKTQLAAGLPSMFGFTVYASMRAPGLAGKIPMPAPHENVVGGHAIVAVGYDDALQITNPAGSPKTKGALLIRNSWGTGWGQGGYGWLPYDYVTKGLAVDWWILISSRWIDTGVFNA